MEKKDLEIKERYDKKRPWGIMTTIDLEGCDPKLISSKSKIIQFACKVVDLMKAKPYGKPQVVRFGEDPRVYGYSMTQLIEASLVSGHFAEESDRAFIDIFSCAFFPPYEIANFCKKFFGAERMHVQMIYRM